MSLSFLSWRPGRYVVIGAVCAAVHNVIMIGGDWAGVNYVPMNFASFAVVAPLGYLLHASFTFGTDFSWRGLLRFTSGLAAGFPISLLLMAIFCTGFGWPVIVATPLTTIILFVWNYTSAHWAILGRLKFAVPPEG
jgi:putative flippase GtrA